MTTNVFSLGRVPVHHVCTLYRYAMKQQSSGTLDDRTIVGVLLFYGSWNVKKDRSSDESVLSILEQLVPRSNDMRRIVGIVQVDESDESLQLCIGDIGDSENCLGQCPPSELPSIAVVIQSNYMDRADLKFVSGIQARKLFNILQNEPNPESVLDETSTAIQATYNSMVAGLGQSVGEASLECLKRVDPSDVSRDDHAIRLFVAGDRSGVGKSSVCLGLLGSLIALGYKPSELAYIKPATQCEAPQLIEVYCKNVGIECVPVGPVVYFKGFTRAFLAGETESSEQLLLKAGKAVDQVARGKRLVLIDGVGFPAVGSICGTDNASVARASGYPDCKSRTPARVLLVGGSGVGAAVDAFNLNSTFFEANNVPVIGAIFNKLSLEGFYSLENCKKEVTSYFDRFQPSYRPFGFVPSVPEISADSAVDHINDFIRIFREHVDVLGIVDAAKQTKIATKATRGVQNKKRTGSLGEGCSKRQKVSAGHGALTRDQIEMKAAQSGAAASA